MSANDEIVLKAHFDTWRKRTIGYPDVDPWLYYCLEQFAKRYGMTDEEIQYGLTDGGQDGGADAIFIIANHGTVVDEDTQLDPKGVSRLHIMFFQTKSSGGFKATEIDKSSFLADDFFRPVQNRKITKGNLQLSGSSAYEGF